MRAVLLAASVWLVVACSSAEPSGGPSGVSGGGSSSGSSSAGAAAVPVAGSSSLGGQASAGTSAGGMTSGSAGESALAGGGAGGQSSAAGAAGAAGASGAAGDAGAAGQGGTSARPEAELDGAGWTMECTKPDTQPGAGDRCWLLPAGQEQCPPAGYTSVDRTLRFGGTPGVTYRVTIRFQGTHEAGDYTGGMAEPKQLLRGATHIDGGLHTWLSMEVSAPAAIYNPNAGANGGSVQVYDYVATIPIEGGATIRLKAYDRDCLMHRYCQNGDVNDCKGLVVPGISPAGMPIDGGFLQMTVQSVTAS